MVNRRFVLVVFVSVLLVAALVAGGYLVELRSHNGTTRSRTIVPEAWTVVATNLTLYPPVGCIPYDVLGPACGNVEYTPALSNVTLVAYEGNEFYDVNFTNNSSDQPSTHTIWFTNSSVFCVGPALKGYLVCPAQPIEPTISFAHSEFQIQNRTDNIMLSVTIEPDPAAVVSIKVMVFNWQNSTNTLPSPIDWAIPPGELRAYCDTQVMGYAVYQGDYGAGNFSQAKPLSLDSPPAEAAGCPNPTSSYYSFQPLSDNATETPGNYATPTNETMSLTDGIAGYWNGTSQFYLPSPSFHVFPPGKYTVVAVDGWGDVVTDEFVVEN